MELFNYEFLKLTWWLFVGILLIGFAVMDGLFSLQPSITGVRDRPLAGMEFPQTSSPRSSPQASHIELPPFDESLILADEVGHQGVDGMMDESLNDILGYPPPVTEVLRLLFSVLFAMP